MKLEVKNLIKKFKSAIAVDNISFVVKKNSTLGLLGPNGCGKTTSIGMMLGLITPSSGEIFIEGINCNYLHTSIFSDIFIRDKNFNILKKKQKGMIQLMSLLPSSYPGHNILTEDVGELIGEDDCKCGLKGKYFKVHGRLKDAELRGCSDVI